MRGPRPRLEDGEWGHLYWTEYLVVYVRSMRTPYVYSKSGEYPHRADA